MGGLDDVTVGEADAESIGGGCLMAAWTIDLKEMTRASGVCYGRMWWLGNSGGVILWFIKVTVRATTYGVSHDQAFVSVGSAEGVCSCCVGLVSGALGIACQAGVIFADVMPVRPAVVVVEVFSNCRSIAIVVATVTGAWGIVVAYEAAITIHHFG